jgi:hypothetical protein
LAKLQTLSGKFSSRHEKSLLNAFIVRNCGKKIPGCMNINWLAMMSALRYYPFDPIFGIPRGNHI